MIHRCCRRRRLKFLDWLVQEKPDNWFQDGSSISITVYASFTASQNQPKKGNIFVGVYEQASALRSPPCFGATSANFRFLNSKRSWVQLGSMSMNERWLVQAKRSQAQLDDRETGQTIVRADH